MLKLKSQAQQGRFQRWAVCVGRTILELMLDRWTPGKSVYHLQSGAFVSWKWNVIYASSPWNSHCYSIWDVEFQNKLLLTKDGINVKCKETTLQSHWLPWGLMNQVRPSVQNTFLVTREFGDLSTLTSAQDTAGNLTMSSYHFGGFSPAYVKTISTLCKHIHFFFFLRCTFATTVTPSWDSTWITMICFWGNLKVFSVSRI